MVQQASLFEIFKIAIHFRIGIKSFGWKILLSKWILQPTKVLFVKTRFRANFTESRVLFCAAEAGSNSLCGALWFHPYLRFVPSVFLNIRIIRLPCIFIFFLFVFLISLWQGLLVKVISLKWVSDYTITGSRVGDKTGLSCVLEPRWCWHVNVNAGSDGGSGSRSVHESQRWRNSCVRLPGVGVPLFLCQVMTV